MAASGFILIWPSCSGVVLLFTLSTTDRLLSSVNECRLCRLFRAWAPPAPPRPLVPFALQGVNMMGRPPEPPPLDAINASEPAPLPILLLFLLIL